ncbi:MAG TPA: ATP-binding protein [Blastocatellia bacterium]|nr:ATP-binding protein [Blastocatellia bacterium]
MRSLFLKIFFWFWVAVGLVGIALIATFITMEPEPLAARWRSVTGAALKFYAQTAVETLERDGQETADRYLKRLEGDSIIRAALIDRQNREVTGRAITNGALELAAKAMASNQAEMTFTGRRTLAAHSADDSRGNRYVLALELPGGPFRALRPQPRLFFWRVIVVLLAAAFVCYLLARYLASPVVKLRAATLRLASGDLKARVGPAIGRRRDELADLGRDFDLMAERIDGLVTAQQRLVSDISHELRSPLARLGVALELARQRAGEDAAGALDRIEREANRLNELIEQLLTLSKLEIGNQSTPSRSVDLTHLVKQIASDADFEARDRDRAVRVVSSESCQTTGSEELLRQAVENVVRNAVRYTAENSEVEISLKHEVPSLAVITVRDHGTGAPESSLADLFRPFYRVADARDRQTGGVGLGLAITERAVKLHGGTVKASNAPGGGLIVEIKLPAERDDPQG